MIELNLIDIAFVLIVAFVPEILIGFFLWRGWIAEKNTKRLAEAIKSDEYDDVMDALFEQMWMRAHSPVVEDGEDMITPVQGIAKETASYMSKHIASRLGVDARQEKALERAMQEDMMAEQSPIAEVLMNMPATRELIGDNPALAKAAMKMLSGFASKSKSSGSGGKGWNK